MVSVGLEQHTPGQAARLYLLLSRPEQARAMGEKGRQKVETKYFDPAFRSNLDRLIDDVRA